TGFFASTPSRTARSKIAPSIPPALDATPGPPVALPPRGALVEPPVTVAALGADLPAITSARNFSISEDTRLTTGREPRSGLTWVPIRERSIARVDALMRPLLASR